MPSRCVPIPMSSICITIFRLRFVTSSSSWSRPAYFILPVTSMTAVAARQPACVPLVEIAERSAGAAARRCPEGRVVEKVAHLWGQAGQRSVARSALAEAAEQLTRAHT